ncbi:DUF7510 family protein [Halobellus salinus]|nr:hypothetical protein [Halobellus salinus]SMP07348.1 hypothetical protein SAMN06265347_102250 [Halobellus salinus]
MTPPHEESAGADGGAGDDTVSFSVTIEGGETVIRMRGDRDTAVVVRSASGERIYLPPEGFDRAASGSGGASPSAGADSPYGGLRPDSPYQSVPTDSPYRGVESESPYQSMPMDSPYQGAESDSPYQAAGETTPSEGLTATTDGYRIRHPEPVTDVRVLR